MLNAIESKQILKTDLKTVWDFMSSPANLQKITPDYMGFNILSPGSEIKMYPGQIIEYTIRPVAGIPMHWVTEITHVKEGEYFVDEQRKGPYSFWHHKHFLRECKDGVEMTDLVHYQIPLGIIGKAVNAVFIRKQLKEIFDCRYKRLDEMFNQN